jgi:hypothetical protein
MWEGYDRNDQSDNLPSMDLPIACTLTDAQLHERRQAIMAAFSTMQVCTTELPDGFAFTFPATTEARLQAAQLVDMERQCCRFLTFKIVVGAARAGMRLEVTGPMEAKKVIGEYFNFQHTKRVDD